ncbi:hypothetical protein [Halorientalis marina]|uniref:hypothetical protein n=1 Tax=Halorientalis marina TaxID=2931976 RepID=UPI001FF3EA40|nr:hypothetical protein [Halorientalis marina]
MAGTRDALLEAFVRSEASPDGKWWVDVPVGLSVGGDGAYATVDAVCLTSREPELPESYTDHHGTKYVVHEQDERVGVDRVDAFRALREKDTFAEETAVLVGVESGASSVGTVGDLLAYQELLEADWDWTVDERLLVSDTDSAHVSHVCRELGVRAIRVA